MQFELIFVSALLFLGPAAAVDLYFYNGSAAACGGQKIISVYKAQAATCYQALPLAASSVEVRGLPSGARAQAYRGYCSDFVSGNSVAGSSCLTGGRINTSNWYYPFKKLVRKTPEAETRFSVTYEQPGGELREIEVPSGHVKRALGLVEARDYNALEEFPTVSLEYLSWVQYILTYLTLTLWCFILSSYTIPVTRNSLLVLNRCRGMGHG